MSFLSMPECPEILLTIFHLTEEQGHMPMTREEILSLMGTCDKNVSPDVLFQRWRMEGQLRERRGRFYVLRETADALLHAGKTPALQRHERTGWIIDNALTMSW